MLLIRIVVFLVGKYLTIPRTEGISTTDIVGRMLLMTRSHHSIDCGDNSNTNNNNNSNNTVVNSTINTGGIVKKERTMSELSDTSVASNFNLVSVRHKPSDGVWGGNPYDRKSNFLTTSHILRLFGAGVKVISYKCF